MSTSTPPEVEKTIEPAKEAAPPTAGAIITREAWLFGSDLFDPMKIDASAKAELELAGVYRHEAVKIALRQTGEAQWVNFKGSAADAKDSFYLTGAGADAVFNFFGLHLSTPGPADKLADHTLYTDDVGRRWWIAESKLWRGNKFVCHCEGKRLIGGFAKNELDAKQDSTENLKSRTARTILGIKGKSLEDMRVLGLDLSRCRVAEFDDHKSKTSDDPNEATVRFGNAVKANGGKPVKVVDLADRDLEWYAGIAEKDVADPSKAKFKPELLLKAIRTEQERRANKPTQDAAANEEFERTIALIREEAATFNVPEAKLEKFIAALETIDQAKKALAEYRERRKKKAAPAPEPGSEG